MNRRLSILLQIFLLFMLSGPAWGRSIISGQVIDAENRKPIERAAVYISWSKTSGPPGLASSVTVETAEVLTDINGFFKVPKYSTLFKDYEMTIYKKGYVCWNSIDIFPIYEKRKGFKLKNGMVIELERFKEEYSKEKHANFTTTSSSGSRGLFFYAIKPERELRRKTIKNKKNRR